ncbi:hypothetical protein PF001_g26184 [Phytophthora fragariae]|uniref:Uncharacterized protein n=1 Tax=Phytophthora fragariae TaxID=53985 RepID=A0A6A3QX58_9STRA|nr:hypothetical protein PF009_g27397 [Phytophthora fragariae]KAE9085417.1 hypothetical protein PF006_g26263 [Phytophthora fragariae]KAE9276314.1 hypothetical protein PF001_g26184 [Phytophthora fragariae]
MDGDFVVTRIAKKPPCRSVLGAIRGRCKSMPDIEPLCLPAVERLEHLHPDVVHRSVEDPLRVQYVEMLVRLWKITYMRPLLVRLAKCDTIAQMIGTLQVDIDGLGRGLGCGDDEEEMTKWRDEWKNSRAQQFSFLERLTSRKLICQFSFFSALDSLQASTHAPLCRTLPLHFYASSMAISTVYVLLKPGSLDTDGYAYGKICSAAQRGKYDVERFSSGRWAETGEFSSHLSAAQVDPRRVSEDEALSGIGTYVGSALCIARVPRGRPKVWDYGMVVGYSWKEDEKSGILQVTFEDKTCEIPYGREELQDLAIETYALRPCIMRSVADVMPTEMRSIHNMVHDHFNGIGQSARRNSTIILRKLKMNQVDEAQLVPVFNIENTRVEYLPIEHILNFVSYFQGKRRAPQGASVPTALFTEPVGPPTAESTPLQSGSNDTAILQQLYDSDDDLVPIDSTQEEA